MTSPSGADLLVEPTVLPTWLQPLAHAVARGGLDETMRFQQPADVVARQSAVLVLFGEAAHGPDVLLIERAGNLRNHAGQPAFPGGAHEPLDTGPVDTALREAQEETRLDPAGVVPVAALPSLWIPPTGFNVTPIVAWWQRPTEVGVGDPGEVAAVHRVPLADLLNPANRVKVTHPLGYVGPGFDVYGMLVWGFTGMVLDRLFAVAGMERAWEDGARVVPFDFVSPAVRGGESA